MQFHKFIPFILLFITKFLTDGAPTDTTDSPGSGSELYGPPQAVSEYHNPAGTSFDMKKADYYEYRLFIASGVQKALDECRERFKWDRWNCPKKIFLSILDGDPLPANKELAYVKSLISAGMVLSVAKSCSSGSNKACGCSHPTPFPNLANTLNSNPNKYNARTIAHTTPLGDLTNKRDSEVNMTPIDQNIQSTDDVSTDPATKAAKFMWQGCDESVSFAFRVAKIYLDSQGLKQDYASRLINEHNFEAGRLAVKKSMKKVCKCHGPSGSCQMKTCWSSLPDMSRVGEYLLRQYRVAAKVGAMSAEVTNVVSLGKELKAISHNKLAFADASPDYCYESPSLGINGTLGRYCSRTKKRPDGTEVGRNERDSCDRLCTKCGYKIKREKLNVEKQCECRFVYCCTVECKRCPQVEDTYKCVRHS